MDFFKKTLEVGIVRCMAMSLAIWGIKKQAPEDFIGQDVYLTEITMQRVLVSQFNPWFWSGFGGGEPEGYHAVELKASFTLLKETSDSNMEKMKDIKPLTLKAGFVFKEMPGTIKKELPVFGFWEITSFTDFPYKEFSIDNFTLDETDKTDDGKDFEDFCTKLASKSYNV